MKLGLLSDIHEHVQPLRYALAELQRAQVDQVVVLGDVVEMGLHLAETCRLLAEARAIGVWGNHDFGLCYEPSAELRARYPPVVMDFLTSLKPRLVLDGCHFTHVEPWLDPLDIDQLWYFEGAPDEHGKLDRIFASTPERLLFGGHFHKWLLCRPHGIVDWRGERPIRLDEGRYFVVVGPLCSGQFATLDTATSELIPYYVG